MTASPIPDGGIGIHCDDEDAIYNITGQYTWQTGYIFVSGSVIEGCTGGCSLSETSDYSVAVTITLGGGLTLSKIAGLGLTASVGITTTKGQSDGISQGCPAGSQCGLVATNYIHTVNGYKTTPNRCFGDTTEHYSVRFPVLVESASQAAPARVDYTACYAGQAPATPVAGFDYPVCPPCEYSSSPFSSPPPPPPAAAAATSCLQESLIHLLTCGLQSGRSRLDPTWLARTRLNRLDWRE
jgi:hypothetical protein